MSKQTLIIVHGMGQSTPESFKKEFTNGIQKAFELYPKLSGKSVEEYVDIVSIGYNHIFDEKRKQLAKKAEPVEKFLLNSKNESVPNILKFLTKLDIDLNKDNFLTTHILDVLFLRYTVLGEPVRLEVGKKIVEVLKKASQGSSTVHILPYSLGTSVIHDTLDELYADPAESRVPNNLRVDRDKLGSLHMIANTSRVLESFAEVDKSIVKPGTGGCTMDFSEYRHVLDPLTWVKKFSPTDNGSWISNTSWKFQRYQLFETTSITHKHGNTHSLSHYLFNPMVHSNIFKQVFNLHLTENEIIEGHDRFIRLTLADIAKDLTDEIDKKLKDLRVKEFNSLLGYFKTLVTLQSFVEKQGGKFNE